MYQHCVQPGQHLSRAGDGPSLCNTFAICAVGCAAFRQRRGSRSTTCQKASWQRQARQWTKAASTSSQRMWTIPRASARWLRHFLTSDDDEPCRPLPTFVSTFRHDTKGPAAAAQHKVHQAPCGTVCTATAAPHDDVRSWCRMTRRSLTSSRRSSARSFQNCRPRSSVVCHAVLQEMTWPSTARTERIAVRSSHQACQLHCRNNCLSHLQADRCSRCSTRRWRPLTA